MTPPLTERRTPHPVALARLLWAVVVEAVRTLRESRRVQR